MTLSNKDQQKLLDAGFTLIRRDYERKAIKTKTGLKRDWHFGFSQFETKKKLDEVAAYLLKQADFIEV